MTKVQTKTNIFYEEGSFKGQKEKEIYFRKYELTNSSGAIVISHGFCESMEKYTEIIKIFNQNNYSVYILDHRGHGKSERLGKYKNQISVEKFQYYVDDLKSFIDNEVLVNKANEKLYLFAHSMGGAIGSLFLEQYDGYFNKAVLSAPMMTMDTGKHSYSRCKIIADIFCLFGKGEEYVLGHGPFDINKSYKNRGTSSEVRYNTYLNKQLKNEYLQTSGASYRWLKEGIKATRRVTKKSNVSKITIPILLFQSGKDTFVKPKGQNKFAKGAKNCKLKLVQDSKHELYRERDEIFNPYINEVLDFYEDR